MLNYLVIFCLLYAYSLDSALNETTIIISARYIAAPNYCFGKTFEQSMALSGAVLPQEYSHQNTSRTALLQGKTTHLKGIKHKKYE